MPILQGHCVLAAAGTQQLKCLHKLALDHSNATHISHNAIQPGESG